MFVLRKSMGPLSAGTPIKVLSEKPGYATVMLANVSHAFCEQIEGTRWSFLTGAFNIEPDRIVKRREPK